MNKEEILKDITRHFGIDNEPQEETAMFILPDGRFMYTDLSPEIEDEEDDDFDDSLISQHNNVDEYIIYKGYAKESNKKPSDETLFQSMFNAIRFQIFDEDVSYLALPTNPPTSSQYDSILKVLDLAENWVGSIEICGSSPSSRGIRYYFNDWDEDADNIYTTDEVLKKIKRYYASGILYEDCLDEKTIYRGEFNKYGKDEYGHNNYSDKHPIYSGIFFYADDGDYMLDNPNEMGDYGYISAYELDDDAKIFTGYRRSEDYVKDNNLGDIKDATLTYFVVEAGGLDDSYLGTPLSLNELVEMEHNDEAEIWESDDPGCWWAMTQYLAKMDLEKKGYDGALWDDEDYSEASNQYQIWNLDKIHRVENKNESLSESLKLDEATRNQLINKTKNSDNYKDQSKGKNRYERRTKSRIATSVAQYNKVDMDALFKRDILTLGVDVHGETDDYVVTVRFVGLLKEVQREIKANDGKLEYKVIARAMSRVFNSGDVSLHCTCPDFKYRQSYNASKQNYGTQYEPRPSNITNPNDTKGGGCKHCMLVLSNLDWMMKVSSVINNYIKYCQEHMEYNYATYIFPKVYGMPYKQAVQTSMFDNGGYLASDQKTVGDVAKRNTAEKDDKGRFIVGNKYRFNKKQNGELNEPDENQLKFNFDEKPKEVIPDENGTNK